jgi:NAD(P)-dependent dehydrogenase (short-subunit alcohol dehydrogenase family)
MVSVDDSKVPLYQRRLRLDGRGFVVVGAGQGIGRQACHALTQAGAAVVCVDNVDERAHEIADEVSGVAAVCDARERGEVERTVAEAERQLGRISGVVDIVGAARTVDILETDDVLFEWELGMVLRHAFLLSTVVGRRMVETGGGCMTFVASVSGLTSAPRHAIYGAFKAGLMSWVRSLAIELGPHGVRANAVAPGLVWTPRVSSLLGEEGRRRMASETPLGRVSEPADVASAILFLSSDLASCVSGHTLVVDGGATAKFAYSM